MDNNQLEKELITPQLLALIAEGDEYSFTVLYRHFYHELQPIGWRCLESGIEPAEVMQLTFMKLWLNRESLAHIDNLKAWIIKVAYREYLMAIRKKMSYEEKLRQLGSGTDNDKAPSTPFQVADYNELKRFTQEIIEGLSPQRKTIYELSRSEGLKIDEIAARLSISPNTVKSVLQTVLKIIKEKLVETGYGPFSFIFFLEFLTIR